MGNAPTVAADTARNAEPFTRARAHDVKCGFRNRDESSAPRCKRIQHAVMRLNCTGAVFDSYRKRLEKICGSFRIGIDDHDGVGPPLGSAALKGVCQCVPLAALFEIRTL